MSEVVHEVHTEPVANVIGGVRRAPCGEAVYARVDPAATDRVLARYPLSAPQEVDEAVAAAARAYRGWAAATALARGAYLQRAAARIRAELEAIARVLAREIGKPIAEARGETAAAANLLDLYGSQGVRYGGDLLPASRPGDRLYAERRPRGVVGLITPWNYPLSIPAWKIGPALLCGNTVVWKPSLQHPATTMTLVSILESAGLPEGVVNLVHGDGPDIGQALVDHPGVGAISFTGSRDVGQHIYRCGSNRLIPVSCEMGGKNPLVVLADCDLDFAARLAIEGGISYAGQKCSGTDRVIVDRRVKDAFAQRLVGQVEALTMGDPLDEGVFLGPVVDEAQYGRVRGMLADGARAGARVLCGGLETVNRPGWYVRASVLDQVDPDSALATEEIFGPALTLFAVDGPEEALALANRTGYGLSAAICTRDLEQADRFLDGIEAGVAYVNRPTAGAEFQAPFGGIKDSGLGSSEQGLKVLDFYSHWRTVGIRHRQR